jgi:hypothetical protein
MTGTGHSRRWPIFRFEAIAVFLALEALFVGQTQESNKPSFDGHSLVGLMSAFWVEETSPDRRLSRRANSERHAHRAIAAERPQ